MKQRIDGSYNEKLIRQILTCMREYGPLQKLKLSQYLKMNYQRCVQYVTFMNRLQWINITIITTKKIKHDVINITENGRNALDLLNKQDCNDSLKNQEELI